MNILQKTLAEHGETINAAIGAVLSAAGFAVLLALVVRGVRSWLRLRVANKRVAEIAKAENLYMVDESPKPSAEAIEFARAFSYRGRIWSGNGSNPARLNRNGLCKYSVWFEVDGKQGWAFAYGVTIGQALQRAQKDGRRANGLPVRVLSISECVETLTENDSH